jgi:hypothetical protein
MSSIDLPHGVPSPDHAHVHPYPTRFHGGIWTRPVFGFPWNRSPYAVFRPSQMNGLSGPYIDPTFRPYHGIGQMWDTGDGVFRRPSYDGGGLFNNVSGLGALPTDAAKFFGAAALAFGVTALLLRR